MGPMIFARGEYRLASIDVQQIPVTSTWSDRFSKAR